MFGMGGTEIIVILIVALLFLGPDKLPGAAKTISKGIRDLKKQSRSLQNQIESDEQIGGAIRDLKSALRGEDEPRSIQPKISYAPPIVNSIHNPADPNATEKPAGGDEHGATAAAGDQPVATAAPAEQAALPAPAERTITLPNTAGETDGPEPTKAEDAELASLIKPASGTVAKGS